MTNINNPAHTTPQSRWEATVDEAAQSLRAYDVHASVEGPSIAQAANEFSEFFKGQWSKIMQELGSEYLAGADAERLGDSALDEIVASTFGVATEQGGQLAKGDLRPAVMSANRLSAENIMATRDRCAATQPVQVVPYRFNGAGEIRFSVIKQAPDIENLVLEGGGAKAHEVFADPVTGASSLSPEEREAFLRAGPPNPQAFANSEGVVDRPLHQAAVQFYEEAARRGASS
jgi:hypothetical protein